MSEQDVELVRRHFEEIWNRRDMSACDELMAMDFVENATAPFETLPPGRVSGPSAMRGTVQWLVSQFPDLRFHIEAIVADGDVVVARVRSTGTNTGRLNGFLPPSGKQFDYVQSHWFRIADGQLAEHWATRDDLAVMLQLGLVTPPRVGALLRQLRSAIPRWLRQRRGGQKSNNRGTSSGSEPIVADAKASVPLHERGDGLDSHEAGDDDAGVECTCCGRTMPRRRVHALASGPGFVCRRCGLWIALQRGKDRRRRV